MNILIKKTTHFLFYSFLSLIILLNTSCSNKKWPAEASKLDSLNLILEKNFTVLMHLDSSTIKNTYDSILTDLKYIELNLKDTIERDEAEMLSNYRSLRKALKKAPEKGRMLQTEYSITNKQLMSLSADLKKGLIEENKAYDYFVIESTEANKLILEIKSYTESVISTMELYNTYKPQVSAFITKINDDTLVKK